MWNVGKKVGSKEKVRKYTFGWVPDMPNHRDFLYGTIRKVPVRLPTKAEDQEDLGSCTENALIGALEFLEKKDRVKYTELSRLFV